MVKDVATVEISNVPRLGWIGRSDGTKDANGKRVVTDQDDVVEAIIVMRKGENPSEVVKNIEQKIKYLNEYVSPAFSKIVPYFERTNMIDYATHTCILHNLIEGILLVVVLISLFLFDWRATAVVAVIIPMSLLFAFICLHLMHMSANACSRWGGRLRDHPGRNDRHGGRHLRDPRPQSKRSGDGTVQQK